ncbi:hypothetical protein GE09DRAFT_1209499 [Coniochaeta sp. 2T2.1]|nr:hypothetical protein GE09DRAFT_1209499 [Coniochaeta sp. 2T2.1]
MKASALLATLALTHGALGSCGWKLKPDDCICMNSVDGSLMDDETSVCCRDMGLKTQNNICGVNHNTRQTFKDCCKWLNETSVIGHCR